MKDKCCAVVAAAGNSRRMGEAKQWISLLGKPVLQWTLEAFCLAEEVDKIVLVIREEDKQPVETLLRSFPFSKPIQAVTGGASRQESILAGAMAAKADWIAVHDGARCLIQAHQIDKVIGDARCFGAAALAVPVKDTIKWVEEEGILSTPDRSHLWAVQTPQVFPGPEYLEAIQKACKEGREYTDDCQLWESRGFRFMYPWEAMKM